MFLPHFLNKQLTALIQAADPEAEFRTPHGFHPER